MALVSHPVHVSISSLEYDDSKEVFRLFVKVYSDDLLTDYRNMTGDPEILLCEDGLSPDKQLIQTYINSRITIELNGKKITGEVTQIESDSLEVRINTIYKPRGKTSKIRVVNEILTDIYPDQANLFIVRIGDWEEGVKFTPENKEITINR